VRELLAPHGDKVRVYLDGLLTHPSSGGGSAKARLRSFIRVRCVGPRRIAASPYAAACSPARGAPSAGRGFGSS
jgi:hypothetical protein